MMVYAGELPPLPAGLTYLVCEIINAWQEYLYGGKAYARGRIWQTADGDGFLFACATYKTISYEY